MSWRLGKSKKSSTINLRAEEMDPRSTTPTPGNPDGNLTPRTGLLTIRVLWAEGITLPPGTAIPRAVQSALQSQQAKVDKILLVGGGAHMPGIVDFFEDLNLKVELGDPLKSVAYSQSLAPILKRYALSLPIAIGLSLRNEN